jgi:hypothetical protein
MIGIALFAVVSFWQAPPKSQCAFDGFEKPGQLAEVIATKNANGSFLIYRVEGDWSCGYLTERKGAGPQWILTKNLRVVSADPKPKLEAWAGTWVGGEDTVEIHAQNGKLKAKGDGVWGSGASTHTGAFEGEAVPDGNHVRITDDDCRVDMTLIGNYIVASDNMQCGGLNVRFQGVWKRGK